MSEPSFRSIPPIITGGDFTVKDSGERMEFESGMVRDTSEGKTRYDLVFDGPMIRRWAEHMTKGAEKYDARNWMKAKGMEEYMRFRESAARHFFQWYFGHRDEDHAAAVFFNINGAEYAKVRSWVETGEPSPTSLGPCTDECGCDCGS